MHFVLITTCIEFKNIHNFKVKSYIKAILVKCQNHELKYHNSNYKYLLFYIFINQLLSSLIVITFNYHIH